MRVVQHIEAFVAIIGVIASSYAFSSCRKPATDPRDTIIVSIEPQRYILEKLIGDEYRVVTLIPNGDNPETFDPTPSMIKVVEDAKIYFTTGFFMFEGNLKLNNSLNTTFINVSGGIVPIYGTHGDESTESRFLPGEERLRSDSDPHIWSSVKNARIITDNMADALAKLNPANAHVYRDRAEAYKEHLDSLDRAVATTIDEARYKKFLIWHPSLSYFARDYGLEQVVIGSESKEPSIGDMRNIIKKAKSDSIQVFFYQQNVDSRNAEAIGASINAEMIAIDPLEYDWEESIVKIAEAIAQLPDAHTPSN